MNKEVIIQSDYSLEIYLQKSPIQHSIKQMIKIPHDEEKFLTNVHVISLLTFQPVRPRKMKNIKSLISLQNL